MIDRTSASNVQSMLETIRAYQAQASGQTQKSDDTVAPKGVPSFTDSVKSLIEKVNDAQRSRPVCKKPINVATIFR